MGRIDHISQLQSIPQLLQVIFDFIGYFALNQFVIFFYYNIGML